MNLFGNKKEETNVKSTTEEFLTVKEVCGMLKVGSGTLRRWEKAGKLKAYYLTTDLPLEGAPSHEFRGKRYKKSEINSLIKPYGQS